MREMADLCPSHGELVEPIAVEIPNVCDKDGEEEEGSQQKVDLPDCRKHKNTYIHTRRETISGQNQTKGKKKEKEKNKNKDK